MAEALLINDASWSGPAASYMITRSVVGADTIQKGCIYIEDDIRKTKTIPRIEIANFIQRRAATPISQGTVTVDGKSLTPRDLMLYYEFNPRDFEAHFYAELLQPRLLGRELPVNAENFMMLQTMKRLNEYFETAIWQSRIAYDPAAQTEVPPAALANYYYFDGLIEKALKDSTVIDVPGAVALTSTNIRSQFQAALNLVPHALLYKYGAGGLKIMISYTDQLAFEQAMREDSFKNENTTEKGINRFSGYDVVPLAGLPAGTFFVCIAKPDIDSNLWLGINSTDDNQLQLQRLQNNSELFFVKGLFKMDTNFGFGDQLVMYTTLTA